MIHRMWTRCQLHIEVKQVGQSFKTLEECPAGNPPGLEPSELMDRCMGCPKAEPQPTANLQIKVPKRAPVPKKPVKKCPPPRKK